MTEKPILMAGAMVRAILSGTKTQTRRIAKYDPMLGYPADWCPRVGQPDFGRIVGDYRRFCPYGQPGESRLWVRETWAAFTHPDYFSGDCDEIQGPPSDMRSEFRHVDKGDLVYRADEESIADRWRPSIHMPRWASRLTLEIVAVRVERLQDISEEDAVAEGVAPNPLQEGTWMDYPEGTSAAGWRDPRRSFRSLWDSLAKPGARWEDSPWVWALEWAPLAKEATP